MSDIKKIRDMLQRHGQSHLLRFCDDLSTDRRQSLVEQIASIDFDQLDELIDKYVWRKGPVDLPQDICPPEIVPARPPGEAEAARLADAHKCGEELIAAGKVAAFVVAGGQGTRLGIEGPKGCFEATPVRRKPLFHVFAEQILAASRRGGKAVPWYIMTSPDNDIATRAFFRRHNNFGLDEKDIFFLVQGTMPAVDFDGKVLLAGKGKPALSPDGHGGSLAALRNSGALDDMAGRGIEYISYFQVDNPLVRCVDPVFLGLHAAAEAQMSAKCLPKRSPTEKLGNFCVVDGKVTVIEYSDLPEELATATTDDGHLRFSAGSIAIHILSRSFVERLTAGGRCELPWHRAEKKVPYVDSGGNIVQPDEPNAVKLEMFVFDAMPLAEKTVIFETVRSQEFSPIKNATGDDSPAGSLHDQVRRAAGWLERAGVTVPRDADGQVAAAIEISPLFADSADELAAGVDPKLTITAGSSLYLGSRGQTGGLR